MLTSIKLKNRISKINLASAHPVTLEYVNLRNDKVNGETRGCFGYIKNLDNGVIVYVHTEPCPVIYGGQQLMYRYARDSKDYRGCMNHWAPESLYCEAVYKALLKPESYDREKASSAF